MAYSFGSDFSRSGNLSRGLRDLSHFLERKSNGNRVRLYQFQGSSEEDEKELAQKILELPGVDAVYSVSGDWDLLVKIVVGDARKIGQIVMRQIRPISGVKETKTILVVEEFTKGDRPTHDQLFVLAKEAR